jgi:hypothetical protein
VAGSHRPGRCIGFALQKEFAKRFIFLSFAGIISQSLHTRVDKNGVHGSVYLEDEKWQLEASPRARVITEDDDLN